MNGLGETIGGGITFKLWKLKHELCHQGLNSEFTPIVLGTPLLQFWKSHDLTCSWDSCHKHLILNEHLHLYVGAINNAFNEILKFKSILPIKIRVIIIKNLLDFVNYKNYFKKNKWVNKNIVYNYLSSFNDLKRNGWVKKNKMCKYLFPPPFQKTCNHSSSF